MIGYLGPEGTFTHQALLSLELPDETKAFSSVNQALNAVRNKEVTASLVPIENSVEGGVSATLDFLAHPEGEKSGRLMIVAEVLLDVQFDLMAKPGIQLEQVKRVLTHPHAAAQCRGWLAENLGWASVSEGGSTAAAAKEVAQEESKFDAAICASIAGQLYGLTPVASKIADNTQATTRFVLVTLRQTPSEATGADKTTFVVYMHRDRPGALMQILEQLSTRGVNLSRIESRPTKTSLGSYCFSIDCEGHIRDERVGSALMDLRRICQNVIFLGSYPRADAIKPEIPFGGTNGDYRSARLWLADLLQGK